MANSKALSLSLDLKTATLLLREVDSLREKLDALREKVLLAVPAKEGSKLWWEKEHLIAEREIREGNYRTYGNVKDMIADLHKGV